MNERYPWFQEGGATCHASNEKPWTSLKIFSSVILKNLWPPRSPYLSIPNFFLVGYLKDKVYESNSQTTDDLKIAITQKIQKITSSILKSVSKKHAQMSSALSPR